MYIKRVKISNFRGVRSTDIYLDPGLIILIGHNNVGKSTILSAIDLVLNPNLQWWRREVLTDLDFFRGNAAEPIQVELLIGCNRPRCVNGENRCARLEVVTEETSETCKLAERTITWDNKKSRFLKIDELESAEAPESVVRLKMTSTYQKAEGYVETSHSILNEDGNDWAILSNPMKEWIGTRLLPSYRDPMADCRMQYNSFLSKAVGEVKAWRVKCAKEFRDALTPVIKELSENRATKVIGLIDEVTRDIGGVHKEETVLSLGDVHTYDIMRQIELCRKGSEGQNEARKEWEIPFSRQGRGLQNIASLALGIRSQNSPMSADPGLSVFMVEEPEQNLEPQMQRHSVKSIRNLCGGNTQIIMSTHSPYVLSSSMDLKGVYRLVKSDDGTLNAVCLASISVERIDFLKLRKSVFYEMDLLETLFAPLVVIWEGESEAGLYPALMRQTDDYPSEWLAGVTGGGDFAKTAYAWFNKAEYQAIVVLDGDKQETLKSLFESNAAFLALPAGRKIESIIAESLSDKADDIVAKILLSVIGSSGFIGWHDDFYSIWPPLAQLFEKEGCKRGVLPTDTALAKIADAASPIQRPQSPHDIQRVLEKSKNRRAHEALGNLLHEQQVVPALCISVLNVLREIWRKDRPLGQYQFDASGELKEYKP